MYFRASHIPNIRGSLRLRPLRSDRSCIGAGALFACLSDGITRDTAEPLALGLAEWQKTLAPAGGSKLVFKDSAFADDVAKTNLAAILSQHGLDDVRSL